MKRKIFVTFLLLIFFNNGLVFSMNSVDNGSPENISKSEKNLLLYSDANWKNFFTSGTEIILTNLFVYDFCTIIMDQSWIKPNPKTMWQNLTSPWLWDTSSFLKNQIAHPYFGNLYFTSARSNGLNFLQSFAMTALGSFLWENCIEAGNNSLNDFITTTFAGALLGEIFYRLGNEAANIHPFLGGLLNPVGGINSILTGRKLGSEKSSIHALTFELGFDCGGQDFEKKDFNQTRFLPGGFLSANVVYDNPYGHSTKEFLDCFSVNMDAKIYPDSFFVSADFDGQFYSWPLFIKDNIFSNFGFSYNYDFDYGDFLFLSQNSFGLFFNQKIDFGNNFFAYGLQSDFIFFGVTENGFIKNSSFIKSRGSTYTFGPEIKLFAEFNSPVFGDFCFNGKCEYLKSYGNTKIGKELEGDFFVLNIDVSYRHKIYKNLFAGIKGEVFKKIRTDIDDKNFGLSFWNASLFLEYKI